MLRQLMNIRGTYLSLEYCTVESAGSELDPMRTGLTGLNMSDPHAHLVLFGLLIRAFVYSDMTFFTVQVPSGFAISIGSHWTC